MKTKLSRLVVAVVALATFGCGANPSPQTDPTRNLSASGRAAYQATKVVKALDVLVSVAAEGERQHAISPTNALKVIAYAKQTALAIDAVPNGWKAVALAGLDQLKADLAASEWAHLAPFATLVRAVVEAFVPPPPQSARLIINWSVSWT